MAYTTISARFATSVATAGTFTVSYPSGMNKGDFQNGTRHVLMAMNDKFVSPTSITVSFGDTSATVTYNGTTTLPAGTEYFMQLDRGGPATYGVGEIGPDGVQAGTNSGAGVATPVGGSNFGSGSAFTFGR